MKKLKTSLHLLIITSLFSSNSLAQEATPEKLNALCDAFETARINVDFEMAKDLVWPEAMAMHADGRSERGLLSHIEYWSKRKKDAGPIEPVRVLERKFEVDGNVAIVSELLGATPDVEAGKKIRPRRRMTTWIAKHGEWRVAALHSSDYSVWEKSIQGFESFDERARYRPGSIVFIGSSSIRGWKTLAEDFPGMPVLGRGFGGSQLIDSIMYAHRIVTPYQPSAVAVYAGDNDVAAGKSADRVFDDFRLLVETIHAANAKVRIGFIAIKPSLKRWEQWPVMKEANDKIVEWVAQDERLTFLDIATPMLGEDGTPRSELFVKDGLHLSRSGYEIWTDVVMPWAANAQ